jgi:hypothetical protein
MILDYCSLTRMRLTILVGAFAAAELLPAIDVISLFAAVSTVET